MSTLPFKAQKFEVSKNQVAGGYQNISVNAFILKKEDQDDRQNELLLEQEKQRKIDQEKKEQFYQSADVVIHSLKKALEDVQKESPKRVMEMALYTARELLRHEIQTNPDLLIEHIQLLVKEFISQKPIKLFLNPKDKSFLKESRPDVWGDFEKTEGLVLQEDSELVRGSCRVESTASEGAIDFEKKWQLLWNEFFGRQP